MKKKQMIQRKNKLHLSTGKGGEEAKSSHKICHQKSIEPADHWAFLDEIEAPMWVDLNFAANPTYKDNDDDWFHVSHPFHQCSSCQLKTAFSHSGEGMINMDFSLQFPVSPKLPSSVSRSRGKHYRSREWQLGNFGVTSKEPHPVKHFNSRSSGSHLESREKTRLKPGCENSNGNAKPRADSICTSSLTEVSGQRHPKLSSSCRDSKTSAFSKEVKDSDNKSMSSITSETSEQQHQKLLEVSCKTIGQTSGLLSALKITLRKSCVTRQASRVERDGGRQSDGCKYSKYSSGKSSVGSSSLPAQDAWSMTVPMPQNRDGTPDSRCVKRVESKHMVELSNVTKVYSGWIQDMHSKPQWEGKTVAARSAQLKAAKSKINQVLSGKGTGLHRVNHKDLATAGKQAKGKVGPGGYNSFAADGKENAIVRTGVSQKTNTRATGKILCPKVTKDVAPQRSNKKGLTILRETSAKGKDSTNVKKVYLR